MQHLEILILLLVGTALLLGGLYLCIIGIVFGFFGRGEMRGGWHALLLFVPVGSFCFVLGMMAFRSALRP